MNMTLAVALAVLAVLLNATRDVPPDARTAGQMWAAVRTHGWWAVAEGLGGLIKMLALAAWGLAVLTLDAASKVGYGAGIALAAICLHIKTLTAPTWTTVVYCTPEARA